VSILDFDCRGKVRTWRFLESHRATLAEAFPHVDILAEARKARAWLSANPTKCKTAKGMPAFLYGWVAREQNNRGGLRLVPPPVPNGAHGHAQPSSFADARIGEVPV
jgi:hypothetical protein